MTCLLRKKFAGPLSIVLGAGLSSLARSSREEPALSSAVMAPVLPVEPATPNAFPSLVGVCGSGAAATAASQTSYEEEPPTTWCVPKATRVLGGIDANVAGDALRLTASLTDAGNGATLAPPPVRRETVRGPRRSRRPRPKHRRPPKRAVGLTDLLRAVGLTGVGGLLAVVSAACHPRC